MQRRIPERWRGEGWRQRVSVVVERDACVVRPALRRGLIGFRASSRLTGVELDFHVVLRRPAADALDLRAQLQGGRQHHQPADDRRAGPGDPRPDPRHAPDRRRHSHSGPERVPRHPRAGRAPQRPRSSPSHSCHCSRSRASACSRAAAEYRLDAPASKRAPSCDWVGSGPLELPLLPDMPIRCEASRRVSGPGWYPTGPGTVTRPLPRPHAPPRARAPRDLDPCRPDRAARTSAHRHRAAA